MWIIIFIVCTCAGSLLFCGSPCTLWRRMNPTAGGQPKMKLLVVVSTAPRQKIKKFKDDLPASSASGRFHRASRSLLERGKASSVRLRSELLHGSKIWPPASAIHDLGHHSDFMSSTRQSKSTIKWKLHVKINPGRQEMWKRKVFRRHADAIERSLCSSHRIYVNLVPNLALQGPVHAPLHRAVHANKRMRIKQSCAIFSSSLSIFAASRMGEFLLVLEICLNRSVLNVICQWNGVVIWGDYPRLFWLISYVLSTTISAGISRDSWHKRRATGGKRAPIRKKRKFELGRPPSMTKVGTREYLCRVRLGHRTYCGCCVSSSVPSGYTS